MDKSNTSDIESIRATRISMLLVDTCTELLRDSISHELKKLNLTLPEYLDKHKADLKFRDFEIDTLFKQPIKEFDICLCSKLLVRLLPKRHVANKQINSLVKIRNENYGHLYKFGLDNKTFSLIFKQIKDCIVELTKIFNLASRESEVNSFENRTFNEAELNKYKDQVMKLMLKDHEHLKKFSPPLKTEEIRKKIYSQSFAVAE